MAEANDDDSSGEGGKKPADDKAWKSPFKSEGEFVAFKTRTESKAAAKAAAEARAAVLAELDIEDETDPEAVKAAIASVKSKMGEADKTKSENAKLAKKLAEADKAIAELAGFKTTTIKTNALKAFSAQFVDWDTATELLLPKLAVDDKGKVVGPDDKSVEETVTALLKAKPFLKAPDFKPGQGTSTTPPKGTGDGKPNGEDRRSLGERMAAELAAQGKLPAA